MWRKIKVFPSSLRRSKTIKNHLNFTFTFEFTLFSASLTAQLESTWSYRWMAWNRVETKHVTTSRSGERRREPKSTAELKIGLRWWWRKHELERRLRNSEKFLFVFIALASVASSCMPSTTVEVSCVVVFISFVVSPFVLDTISSDLRISFGGRAKTRALCCYDVMSRALFGNLLFTSLFFESTVWEMETWTRKLNDGIWRVSDVDLCCCSSTWNFSFTFFLRGDEEMRDEISLCVIYVVHGGKIIASFKWRWCVVINSLESVDDLKCLSVILGVDSSSQEFISLSNVHQVLCCSAARWKRKKSSHAANMDRHFLHLDWSGRLFFCERAQDTTDAVHSSSWIS